MGGQYAKGIAAYDPKSGVFVEWFPSAREAARQFDVHHTAIAHALSGRYKTAGGFVWRLAPLIPDPKINLYD